MNQAYSRLWLLMAFFLAISTSISTSTTPDLHNHYARSTISSGRIVDHPEIVSPLDHHHQQQHLPPIEDEQDDNYNENYNDNTTKPLSPRQTTLPTPFDTSLGTNFTSPSCPKFFDHFLASSSSFTTCHPLSMLLRNSYAFFTYTLHSPVATSHLLDTTCSVDPSQAQQCANTLSQDLATELLKPQHCGDDYKLGNPLVVDAYLNLVVYEPVYRVSCLKDPGTDEYCFVDAVTNSSSPADYALYFLPFGEELPDHGKGPSCTSCLKASMQIFRDWARRDGQPLAGSYLPSAKVVNRYCGDGFADLNVTVGDQRVGAATSGGCGVGRMRSGWSSFLIAAVGLVLVVVLGDGF